jgi:drug/metabolite transporter (DMT)-like permease
VNAHGAHHHHTLAPALPLLLAGGGMLTSLDATAKYLVRDHSILLVVWARYAGQMAIVTPFARHRAGKGFWRTRHLRMQLLRSACLVAATACFFSGLRYLPLAEASAITFLAPVLIVILAQPVLGERPTRSRWAAVAIGFVGMLIILRPGSVAFQPAAILLLATAFFNGLYYLLTRRVTGDSVHTTLFYSALVGAVGTTLALPLASNSAPLTAFTASLLVLLGLFAGTGHWLMTRAYLIAPASLLTPFTYVQMVWATMFGYFVFAQIPDRWSFVGMAIIVGSGVLLALAQRRHARLVRRFP